MDINEESFNNLLARLEPDLSDSTARYKKLRLKLTKFFQWKRCDDPEGLADETVARIIKNTIEGKEIYADNPYVYIFAVAKYVFNEYVRKEIKNKELLGNFSEPQIVSSDWEDCRIQCLQKLPPGNLQFLNEYFLGEKSSQELADELKISINALRIKIYRLKKDLEACYEDCRKKLSKS
jgi:DNA-directed RNA polymerase specialized sigma24 family protein